MYGAKLEKSKGIQYCLQIWPAANSNCSKESTDQGNQMLTQTSSTCKPQTSSTGKSIKYMCVAMLC